MGKLRDSFQRSKRIWRAIRGRDLLLQPEVGCSKLSLGNEGAQWCVCPSGLSSDSVVYSFGVGQDVSFDLELIRRFGVMVHAFDPTPRAGEWLRSQELPSRFVFHDYGVAGFDGMANFTPPQNPGHVSYAMIERLGDSSSASVAAPVRRLGTIMKELGHEEIHVLKMDIEGAEYAVLRDLVDCGLRVDQLLMEFHHRWPEIGVDKTRTAIRELNQAGYRIFNVTPSGEEYSFRQTLRRDGG